MHLKELVNWNAVIAEHLEKSFEPYAATEIARELDEGNTTKLSSFVNFVQMISIAPELQFSLIVQRFLPLLLTDARFEVLGEIRSLWATIVVEARSTLVIPDTLKNMKFQRRLWQAIEHLKCVNRVQFAYALRIITEALTQIQALQPVEPTAIQFAIVYSDCQELPGYFLVINSLVVRQQFMKLFQKYENEMFMWHGLEAALLKLLSRNDRLMSMYLQLQQDLMSINYS
jgi:hypothetical protein